MNRRSFFAAAIGLLAAPKLREPVSGIAIAHRTRNIGYLGVDEFKAAVLEPHLKSFSAQIQSSLESLYRTGTVALRPAGSYLEYERAHMEIERG